VQSLCTSSVDVGITGLIPLMPILWVVKIMDSPRYHYDHTLLVLWTLLQPFTLVLCTQLS